MIVEAISALSDRIVERQAALPRLLNSHTENVYEKAPQPVLQVVEPLTHPDALASTTASGVKTPREQAREYLEGHPEHADLSSRELARITGLSKDAFTRARKRA